MIQAFNKIIDGWEINISDKFPSDRNHENPNKYNLLQDNRICRHSNCNNTYMITRTSGLCNEHKNHEHDLFLQLMNADGTEITPPRHKEIIDSLMLWSSTRNFSLDDFFSELSFNILGNIPDVTSMSGDISYDPPIHIPSINDIYIPLQKIVERYFPQDNTSSYQVLQTTYGPMSAILLANIFVGLLICEEANRGDRWFFRNIIKDEAMTKQLGAAMPIAYYAAKSFRWGIEINSKLAHNLTK